MSIFKIILLGFSLGLLADARATIYEPHVLWSKKRVKTCFYDELGQLDVTKFNFKMARRGRPGVRPGFFKKSAKKKIKSVVNEYFTPEATGISFYGWEDCSKGEADVILVKPEGISRKFWFDPYLDLNLSSIGEGGIRRPSSGHMRKGRGIKPMVILTSFNPHTIAHEFGHLAGLRHEHVHPDAKKVKGLKCRVNLNGFRDYRDKRERLMGAVILPYDHESVMNYCRMALDMNYKKMKVLSDLDKSVLLRIYGEFREI